MAQNMYRVGDCVYFENSSTGPYNIRKIEELSKNASGNVEARVVVYYRRRDISSALLKIADQAERRSDESCAPQTNESVDSKEKSEDMKAEDKGEARVLDWGLGGLPSGSATISKDRRLRLRQHELFLSRQVETLPATMIRGKCSVHLLSEIDTPQMYEGNEDTYFYSLVYDPTQMSLLADKGSIRVGEKYQAEVSAFSEPKEEVPDVDSDNDNKENGTLVIDEEDENDMKPEVTGKIEVTDRETLVYHPYHNLTGREIDQFLVVARSVGTFSRALDTNSSTKLPSLHMTAAAASRDVTIFHAMALLHQAGYDLAQGMKYLVPTANKEEYPLNVDKGSGTTTVTLGGPILIRDQMEEWSAAEANLFEEALDKNGKDFFEMRADYLPWKSVKDIVEYYYMWKTTNRYIDSRKKKMSEEKESRLKQVYIPNHNKPYANVIGTFNTSGNQVPGTSPCEGCKVNESNNWYAWGPSQLQLGLCQTCWTHWKKFAGLPSKHEYERYDLEGVDVAAALEKLTPSGGAGITKGNLSQIRPNASSQFVARLGNSGTAVQNSGHHKRNSFLMVSNLFTRIGRKMATKDVLNMKKQARRPFDEIEQDNVKEYMKRDITKMVTYLKSMCGDPPNRISKGLQDFIMQQMQLKPHLSNKRPAVALASEPAAKRVETSQSPPTRTCIPSTVPILGSVPVAPLNAYAGYSSTGTLPADKSSARRFPRQSLFCFATGPCFRRHRKQHLPKKMRRMLALNPCTQSFYVSGFLSAFTQAYSSSFS